MSFDASGKLDELAAALSALQGELPVVVPTGIAAVGAGGSRKYKYASLADVWRAVQPLLAKHGLSVVQTPCSAPLSFSEQHANVGVTTALLHRSGSYISNTLWLPLSQVTAQGAGSAITYARRYALCAMLGVVADDDDDGASATIRKTARDSQEPLVVLRTEPAAGGPSPAPSQRQGPELPPPLQLGPPVITRKQRERMFAIADQHGWKTHELKELVARHGFESSKYITRAVYDTIILAIEEGVSAPTGEVIA